MSEREKKLAILFGVALFILANFYGFKAYTDQKTKIAGQMGKAKSALLEARSTRDLRDAQVDEMQWLLDNTPEPKNGADVQTDLQRDMSNQANSNGLTIKRQRMLPTVEEGHFHRVKVEFSLNGMEEALYRWLDRFQAPEQLRAVTRIQLSAQRDDETKIDCTVEVDQWFLPDDGSATVAAPAPPPEEPPAEDPNTTAQPPEAQNPEAPKAEK